MSQAADKPLKSSYQPPYEVTEMVDMFHKIARAYGYDIDNRIAFRDRKSGTVYR